jgi:hypothetical protein
VDAAAVPSGVSLGVRLVFGSAKAAERFASEDSEDNGSEDFHDGGPPVAEEAGVDRFLREDHGRAHGEEDESDGEDDADEGAEFIDGGIADIEATEHDEGDDEGDEEEEEPPRRAVGGKDHTFPAEPSEATDEGRCVEKLIHSGATYTLKGEGGKSVSGRQEARRAESGGISGRPVEVFLDLAPIFLGGAAFPGPAEDLIGAMLFTPNLGAGDFFRGCQVFEKIVDELGADPFFGEPEHLDGADHEIFFDLNGVPGFDGAGGFGGIAMDGDLVQAAGGGGLVAGFEEAGGPEPFIDADGFSHGASAR